MTNTQKRTKPKWVFRRVATAFTEVQSKMLDDLLKLDLKSDATASMTTVMHKALENLHKQTFNTET